MGSDIKMLILRTLTVTIAVASGGCSENKPSARLLLRQAANACSEARLSSYDPKTGELPRQVAAEQFFSTKCSPEERMSMSKFWNAESDELDQIGIPETSTEDMCGRAVLMQALLVSCIRYGEVECTTKLLSQNVDDTICYEAIECYLVHNWPRTSEVLPLTPLFDVAAADTYSGRSALRALHRCCSQLVPTSGLSNTDWLERTRAWYLAEGRSLTLSEEYCHDVFPGTIPSVGLTLPTATDIGTSNNRPRVAPLLEPSR